MTREEAMEYIIPSIRKMWNEKKCDEILKALKQAPWDDAVSRQAVLNILDDMVKGYINENDFDKAQGVAWIKVQKLPPVTPQPKTGTWEKDIDNSRRRDKVRFYCSECGNWQTYGETDFLP